MKKGFCIKKTIVFLGILFVIAVLYIISIISAAREEKSEGNGIIEYVELSSLEKEKLKKSRILKEAIRDYDKKNIVESWVYLEDTDNEISYADIFIVVNKEITDISQKNKILSLVGEIVELDKERIGIEYMDLATYTSLGSKK